jgi:hypothetical protein
MRLMRFSCNLERDEEDGVSPCQRDMETTRRQNPKSPKSNPDKKTSSNP